MANRRTFNRQRKRIKIRFGIGEATKLAYTEDISDTGIFVKTMHIPPINTRLLVEFSPEERGLVRIEARVMWAKKVPATVFHLAKKAGFGLRFIRFLDGESIFQEYYDSLLNKEKILELTEELEQDEILDLLDVLEQEEVLELIEMLEEV